MGLVLASCGLYICNILQVESNILKYDLTGGYRAIFPWDN